jgi:hypothetical protein
MSIREDSPEDQEPVHTQRRHDEQEFDRPTPSTSPERPHQQPAAPASTHPVKAVEAARTDLFATMRRVRDNDKPKTVAVNIATAQRLVLADMQHDIAAQTALVLGDAVRSVDIKHLGVLVKGYCTFIHIVVVVVAA